MTARFLLQGSVHGGIVAVQESFGKQFFGFRRPYNPGDIIDQNCHNQGKRFRISESETDPMAVRIIALVHVNTVLGAVRRSGFQGKLVPRLCWYEVHTD